MTSKEANDTILVLGATGKAGRRIVPRLRLSNVDVRAASRSSAVRFDWADPSGWQAVLRGVDAIYVVPPAVPGPVHELVEQAQHAGVRRLVLQSGHGADRWGDTDFGKDMLSAEEAVRASSLEWTVLRAANFAQNFDEELWHGPLLQGELALPAGSVPEPFIDLEDVAEVATAVLTRPGGHAGETYELTGPRSLRFEEAVDIISRASGRRMTYRQISADDYVAVLLNQGVPREAAHDVAEMFVMMDSGVLAGTETGVQDVLGRTAGRFEDYAARVAATGAWHTN
ncbi:MAG: NAD(P)H-binding protein [Nakamurella sp.]